MKMSQKVTVSMLSLLMLSGVSVGLNQHKVNAKTTSQESQAELIKELETPPQVEFAQDFNTVQPVKPKGSPQAKKTGRKKARKPSRRMVRHRQHKARHGVKRNEYSRKPVQKQVHKRSHRHARVRKHIHYHVRKNVRKRTRKPRRRVSRSVSHKRGTNWFTDGLSRRQLVARNWVTAHESGHEWNVLSYGGVCVGYFQMNPGYLGYKDGHINLDHAHQVKVADRYVQNRYGSWVNAQRFWATHNWY